MLSFCLADAAADSRDLDLVLLPSVATPRASTSMSGAEFLPSSTRGGSMVSAACFCCEAGLRLTHSSISVTEADLVLPDVTLVPDDWLRVSLTVSSSGFSKSADLGRCLRRALKSIALDSIRSGFLLPVKLFIMYC